MAKIPFVYKRIHESLWVIVYGGINLGRVQKVHNLPNRPNGYVAIRQFNPDNEPTRYFDSRQSAAQFLKATYQRKEG